MPLLFQNTIRRAHLRANPKNLYLFGDNEQRRGLGGLARECRGEPNAVGIATNVRHIATQPPTGTTPSSSA